jgi:hypothetical protein
MGKMFICFSPISYSQRAKKLVDSTFPTSVESTSFLAIWRVEKSHGESQGSEPVFLNVYGAPHSNPAPEKIEIQIP